MSKSPRHTFILTKAIAFVVFVLSGLVGCGDDTTNNSTTDIANPNPSTLTPTGTLQGQVTDAVTGAAIIGAVVNIGLQSATTDASGHYVLYGIPANSPENTATGYTGSYQATVDLAGVTAPVNMTDSASVPRYPVRKPSMPVNVTFSSFNESVANGGTASNHDTPLFSLVANHDFKVGKLSATVRGVARDQFRQPKGQAVVELRSAGGKLEASTSTDTATGSFSFVNVEAGVEHMIKGRDSVSAVEGEIGSFTLSDNQTLDFGLRNSESLVLASVDAYKPRVTQVSPDNNSDVAPGNVDVVLLFNEPIKMDSYATPSTAAALGNIYKDISVKYKGLKGGAATTKNVVHSMAWNSSRTALTISLPTTGTSSSYKVDFSAAIPNLRDMVGNFGSAVDSIATSVDFSTRGATAVAAPSVAIVNSGSIGHGTTSVALDWSPVAGATNGYNVYRSEIQSGRTEPMVLLAQVALSTYTDNTAAFVSGVVALSYNYSVTAVNADLDESALSAAVLARDVIPPSIPVLASTCVTPSGTSMLPLPSPANTVNGQVRITFSEPMPEGVVENISNYTLASATLAPATLAIGTATQVTSTQVVLEFATVGGCPATSTITLTGITDLAGNAYPSVTAATF